MFNFHWQRWSLTSRHCLRSAAEVVIVTTLISLIRYFCLKTEDDIPWHWLVVWNIYFCHINPYIGNSNPNQLIFFRGVETTNHDSFHNFTTGDLAQSDGWFTDSSHFQMPFPERVFGYPTTLSHVKPLLLWKPRCGPGFDPEEPSICISAARTVVFGTWVAWRSLPWSLRPPFFA